MGKPFENSGSLNDKFGDFKFSPSDDLWDNIQSSSDNEYVKGFLSSKFSEFNLPAPTSAWNNIELSLHPERNKRAIIWWWGVAASVLILISMNGLLNYSDDYHANPNFSYQDIESSSQENQLPNHTINVAQNNIKTDRNKVVRSIPSKQDLTDYSSSGSNTVLANVNTNETWTKPSLNISNSVDFIMAKYLESDVNSDTLPLALPGWNDYHITPTRSLEIENNLAGNFSPTLASTSQHEMLMDYSSTSSFTANPGTGAGASTNNTPLAVYDLEIANQEKYQPPFAIGANYGYTINKRWVIESGVNLTIMNSNKDYANGTWTTEQDISRKYLGIPLQLTIKFLQKRRFNLYTSLGSQFEFGLRRSIKVTDFDQGNKVNSYTTKAKLGNQANAFAGLGFNYSLRENLGLYLQSSVSHYYFQSHANMWSQKAFWPGFQVGVRYNW